MKSKFENALSLAKVEELRKVIFGFDRKLEEGVAYGMPCFRTRVERAAKPRARQTVLKEKRKILCCYLVCKNHLGFYPYSGNILKKFDKEIRKLNLKYSSGALQLLYDKPVPKDLVKKILQARKTEVLADEIKKSKKRL